MAKIGNEARLILKLADERASQRKAKKAGEAEVASDFDRGFLAGYNRATDEYHMALVNVVLELEENR